MRPAGSVLHAKADRAAGERFNWVEPLRGAMPAGSEIVITVATWDIMPILATCLTCLLGSSTPRHTLRPFPKPTLAGHGW
jgi:hypothetical protein